MLAHSLPLDGDGQVRLVAGVTGPAQLATVTPALPAIAAALRETGRTTTPHDVLVDVGRLDATTVPWALLPGCDLVVLVARPTLRQVRQLRTQLGTLREHLDHDGPQPGLGLLLIGDVPYSAGEVAAAVGLPVLAVLADDPAAARVLSDGEAPNRSFARSALLRSARQAAQSLSETAPPIATAPADRRAARRPAEPRVTAGPAGWAVLPSAAAEPSAEVDPGLVRRLRRAVADRLAEELVALRTKTGTEVAADDQRMLGRTLVAE